MVFVAILLLFIFVLVLAALCLKRDVKTGIKIPFCTFIFETKSVGQKK